MSNPVSTTTNTLPRMPFHFIPQGSSPIYGQIHFAHQNLSEVDIGHARNKALEKFKQQSTLNLPDSEGINNPQVAAFLNPENQAHRSNEFTALKDEYIKLKEPLGNRTITGYVKSVEKTTQNVNKKFDAFLKKEKQAFHEAYKLACPDEEKRKVLWEMYAKNLRVNMQAPLEQFTKDIDNLVPQAFIHYVNRLGKNDLEHTTFARYQGGQAKEKLEQRLQYTDSKGNPITITKDKQTGEPSELRLEAMSSLFGSSGDIGDAYAILAASHGKDVPIRVVVPVFEDDNLYTEMKDFIALLIFFIFAQIYKHMEKSHYLKQGKQAAIDKGISLDNISLVDTQNRPIKFSKKDKAQVAKKLYELERDYLAGINLELEEEENQHQHQQPSLKPIAA